MHSLITKEKLNMYDKLKILTDAAKYDVACTSSGVTRDNDGKGIGNTLSCGICHSFSADGRCISLLKILFTNECIYDCKYCINRKSNDVKRTTFTPDEICELTIEFYKRNYIEGLFLSSGIVNSPDYTMELIFTAIYKLRTEYAFNGYIHVKAIPGASQELIYRLGLLADRMSINLEFPTSEGLTALCPNKTRKTILKPMRMIQNGIVNNKNELALFKSAPKFVPGGQSTQMVIGATGESDYEIINVAESLYNNFSLKRVFYSGFININEDKNLPTPLRGVSLLREHRLYQADWLMRYYEFSAGELLDEKNCNFNTQFDPKANWAIKHIEFFPIEINRADYHELLRVPGIGVTSAKRIIKARRLASLSFDDLKKIGVVLKRALYFITCSGKMMYPTRLEEKYITDNLLNIKESLPLGLSRDGQIYEQMSLFDYSSFSVPNSKQIV